MKIISENWKGAEREISMEEAIDRVTDNNSHGSGQLENLEHKILALSALTSRLIEVLVEKKILNANDVDAILGLFHSFNIKEDE